VHDEIVDGKRKLSDAIKCLFWRAQKKTEINGGRGFYCLRKTAATEIEKIDPLVTEMFLGHAERGMKRHYAERHFEQLDEALEKLAGAMGLVNGTAMVSA
jgi:integrase